MKTIDKHSDQDFRKIPDDQLVRSDEPELTAVSCDTVDCKAARLAYEAAIDIVDQSISNVNRLAGAQREAATASGGLATFALGLGIIAATVASGGTAVIVIAAVATVSAAGAGFFGGRALGNSPATARAICGDLLKELSEAKRNFIRSCPTACLPNPFPSRVCP